MKVAVKVAGSVAAIMRAEIAAGEKAVKTGIGAAGTALKLDWRAQIAGAGFGRRLGNTVRSATYPKSKDSLNAAAMVWTNAPKIVAAHEEGATIRSKDGFWLAIPTPAAGKKAGGARITPGEWEQRRGLRLRFVYRKGKPSFLVAEARVNKGGQAVASRSKTGRGVATVPIFIMVPQVRLPKRLDLLGAAKKAISSVPDHILRAWST